MMDAHDNVFKSIHNLLLTCGEFLWLFVFQFHLDDFTKITNQSISIFECRPSNPAGCFIFRSRNRNYINNFLDCKCKYFNFINKIYGRRELFNVHCCLLIDFIITERLSHRDDMIHEKLSE